jgi:hypothetical protein
MVACLSRTKVELEAVVAEIAGLHLAPARVVVADVADPEMPEGSSRR